MKLRLAIDGGKAVRDTLLPVIRVSMDEQERQQVNSVLDARAFCSINKAATKVKELEANFASYVGVKHALAFSSGTTAQHASLAAANIGPGDEVIVPPLTFISTAYTVLMRQATVVFADVEDGTFNLDPAKVAEKITPRTRAIVPVHWFGHPVDMDPLLQLAKDHDLKIIEDCAHACGMTYKGRGAGTMGDMACWSLQESKLITSAGDGGFFTTDDDELANAARMMRDHGKSQVQRPGQHTYEVVSVGNNYRLTEVQAAFGIAQLNKIDQFRARRREQTEYYNAAFEGIPQLRLQARHDDVGLAYSYYPIRVRRECMRVELRQFVAALAAEGIASNDIGSHELCHIHPLFTERSGEAGQQYGMGTLPVAEKIADELLILPLYPDLTREDMDHVIEGVRKVVAAYAISE